MQTEAVIVPLDFHLFFTQTHSCMSCHQPIRHEMHLHNHWKKYHKEKVKKETPRYFVWFQEKWIEVNMETCLAAMLEKRAWAITKPSCTKES